jgi:hypothetical protein
VCQSRMLATLSLSQHNQAMLARISRFTPAARIHLQAHVLSLTDCQTHIMCCSNLYYQRSRGQPLNVCNGACHRSCRLQIAEQQDRLREQGEALTAHVQALADAQAHVAKLEESIANSSALQKVAHVKASSETPSPGSRQRSVRCAATSPSSPLLRATPPSPAPAAAQEVCVILSSLVVFGCF